MTSLEGVPTTNIIPSTAICIALLLNKKTQVETCKYCARYIGVDVPKYFLEASWSYYTIFKKRKNFSSDDSFSSRPFYGEGPYKAFPLNLARTKCTPSHDKPTDKLEYRKFDNAIEL
ncbi:hypothetical protein HELRODRAFT_160612 [Helobdella robusta]|uniref:Uncharacterized protein n=1 Tax=Helobdella robusta TaxID=6412 RepID=T1EQH8_HELRO|nr:hypothetical protein HELRODRAFT_160612 [Helobdella robusta]ESO06442.1 hypothetical protein HELRODRAFT_160612 [Helobdella robusta]